MHRKNDFIRLHRAETNISIVLNLHDIVFASAGDNGEKNARIVLNDDRVNPFYVMETPDKIYTLVKETSEFVRFHRMEDNTTILVNRRFIRVVTHGEGKDSMILLKDERVCPFYVNETPDKVFKILEISNEQN